MLKNIITNPIETANGCRNPIRGIALRGPLSQFFSAIYLKPLDDAFDKMNVFYLRYQDDIIILCKTKRSLNRCKRRMMEVLHERGLKLSRKKSRIGKTDTSFHFLGIQYPGTQSPGNTNAPRANIAVKKDKDDLFSVGVNQSQTGQFECKENVSSSFVPHARTLRKARLQVNIMVFDGLSAKRIMSYLQRWAAWWLQTAGIWEYKELLNWFIRSCWSNNPAASIAAELLELPISRTFCTRPDSGENKSMRCFGCL